MKILNLISTFKHWDDECSGMKPYTIRDLTPRLIKLSKGVTHVKIRRGYTKMYFIRKITHTLDWKDNRIFAWNFNEKSIGYFRNI